VPTSPAPAVSPSNAAGLAACHRHGVRLLGLLVRAEASRPGVSGAVASAVTTALLASRLVHAGTTALPAATGYDHTWLYGAAVAAAGAMVAAAAAYAARTRTRHHAARSSVGVSS
jgi:hypothetical protein